MKENKSIYDKLVGRRRFIEQSNADFLTGCNNSLGTEDAMIALGIRKILGGYASPSVETGQILWNYKIEEDLGIYFADSLNLVDVSLSMEKEIGFKISDSMLKDIRTLNELNATVSDIVKYFINRKDRG